MATSLNLIIALDRDSVAKHLPHVSPGGALIYNSDDVKQEPERDDIQLCPISYKELTNDPNRKRLMLNVCAASVALQLVGVDLSMLEDIIIRAFLKRKGQAIVDANMAAAQASYNYAAEHFTPFDVQFEKQDPPLAFGSGNMLMAMGGASAGVKFYAAYPMSPSTGVLHWMAPNARDLGIIVRQCEDEISVVNMVIGAAHVGCRAMCATSGGGFALMSEAIGSAGMMEIPIVVVNVQRGGSLDRFYQPKPSREIYGKCSGRAKVIFRKLLFHLPVLWTDLIRYLNSLTSLTSFSALAWYSRICIWQKVARHSCRIPSTGSRKLTVEN